jgi:acyl carrier protein
MNVEMEVVRVLDEVLGLDGRSASFTSATHLLGAVPELDSMAVVSIITALEERLGIVVDDGDIDGSTFETVGSLVSFVAERVGG